MGTSPGPSDCCTISRTQTSTVCIRDEAPELLGGRNAIHSSHVCGGFNVTLSARSQEPGSVQRLAVAFDDGTLRSDGAGSRQQAAEGGCVRRVSMAGSRWRRTHSWKSLQPFCATPAWHCAGMGRCDHIQL